MRKKIICTGILVILLLTSYASTGAIINKTAQNNKTHQPENINHEYYFSANNFINYQTPSYTIIDGLQQILTIDELNTKIIIENDKNDIFTVNNDEGEDGGFNPTITEFIVWFRDLSDVLPEEEYYYNLFVFAYKATNIGESYTCGDSLNTSLHFYGIWPDETERWLCTSNLEISSEDPTHQIIWEHGESITWSLPAPIDVEWGKLSYVRGEFEIVEPENSPDSNPGDNIITSLCPEGITVLAHVQNLSGNPVKDADIYYDLEIGVWVGSWTDEKGNCKVSIPPREPLDELFTYELEASKKEDSQTNTTEPVMEGQETNLSFELDVVGVKSKSAIKHHRLSMFERFPLLYRLFPFINKFIDRQ
jgi:hypothetical protein